MKIQKSWLNSHQANWQRELGQQDLVKFGKDIFYIHTKNKNRAKILELGDFLISLGVCPNIQFLYNVL